MQGMIRAIAVAYLIFITFLLFCPDPTGLIDWRGFWKLLGWMMPCVHFLAFFSVTLLALAPRWPAPRWAIALMLALYAGATELAQNFFPPRRPEWNDWFQDLGGIALGAVSGWLAFLLFNAAIRAWRRRVPVPAPAEQWQVLRNIMSRSTFGKQSWWG